MKHNINWNKLYDECVQELKTNKHWEYLSIDNVHDAIVHINSKDEVNNDNLVGFVYQVARSKYLNERTNNHRRAKRRNEHHELIVDNFHAPPLTEDEVQQQKINDIELVQMYSFLQDKLNETARVTVQLFLKGVTYKDISIHLNIAESTARGYVHKAKKLLTEFYNLDDKTIDEIYQKLIYKIRYK